MPTSTSAAPRQLSDGNSQGTVLGGVTNSAGLSDKIAFYGATPVAQTTGFGTPTGGAILTNFPGASATLAQTTAMLAYMITVFKTMGLIGA